MIALPPSHARLVLPDWSCLLHPLPSVSPASAIIAFTNVTAIVIPITARPEGNHTEHKLHKLLPQHSRIRKSFAIVHPFESTQSPLTVYRIATTLAENWQPSFESIARPDDPPAASAMIVVQHDTISPLFCCLQ